MPVIDDDELETRIRSTLATWADQAPVGDARVEQILGGTTSSGRRRAPMILAAAAILVAVVLLVSLLPANDDSKLTIAGPGTGPIRIVVGQQHGVRAVAAEGDSIWVNSSRDQTLYRVDAASRDVVDAFPTNGLFEGVAAGDGLVWLTGYEPTRVVALDAATGAVVHEIPIAFDPWDIELAFGAAWLGGGGRVTRIDVETGVTTDYQLGRSTGFLAAAGDSLWVANPEDAMVTQLDPVTGRPTGTVDVGGDPRRVALSPEGDLWVTLPGANEVVRVDPLSRRVTGRVRTGAWPDAMAFSGDEVWVSVRDEGTVARIGRDDLQVVAVHPVGNVPGGIVPAAGRLWISLHQESALVGIDPAQPPMTTPPPTFERSIRIDGRDVYLRCRGTGPATVVLQQDVWHGAGALPVLEAMLASRTRVCVAGRPEDRATEASQLAPSLRAALEDGAIPGPYVVVGHGYGGQVARELAATWSEVAALVLVDTNTVPGFSPEELGSPLLGSMADRFSFIDRLDIRVPTLVVAADADATTDDPRVGSPATRGRWQANQRALAERLGAELAVVAGDPWPPTYQPAAVAELILGMVDDALRER